MEEVEIVSFEDAFDRLEQTVGSLEQGELSLERALVLFEEGMQLVRRCNTMLDAAEIRLKQLVPDGDGYRADDLEI